MAASKFKRVLIALDYNPSAQKVAESGYALGKSLDAEIILVHVITDPILYSSKEFSPLVGFTGYIDTVPLQLDSIEGLRNASQHFLDKTKHHLGDEKISTVVEEGEYAESIIKVAKKESADIIIIGSHSRKWLENIVMGSVTEKVLRHTSIPLFIIPIRQKK